MNLEYTETVFATNSKYGRQKNDFAIPGHKPVTYGDKIIKIFKFLYL